MTAVSLDTRTQKIPGNIVAIKAGERGIESEKAHETSIRLQKENLLKDLENLLSKNDQLPDNLKKMTKIFINAAKLTLNRKSHLKFLEFQKESFSRSIPKVEDLSVIRNGSDKEGLQFEADLRKDTMKHLKQFDDEISRFKGLVTKAEKYESTVFLKLYETGDTILTQEGTDCTARELLFNKRLVATREMLQLLGNVKPLYGLNQ